MTNAELRTTMESLFIHVLRNCPPGAQDPSVTIRLKTENVSSPVFFMIYSESWNGKIISTQRAVSASQVLYQNTMDYIGKCLNDDIIEARAGLFLTIDVTKELQ